MPPSRLDAVYRSILLTKFFTKGWGNPENLRRIFEFRKIVANREACYSLIPSNYPVNITKDEEWSDCHVLEGNFQSPFDYHLPGIMPEETKTAHFQMILPKKWTSHNVKPICLHLAGTGDHFFWRRRNLIAKPLLKESGIGSILLENPFYGLRKPKDQVRSSLHNVSDIFIMGGCLILESIVLLNWCEQQGYKPLGLTGLSMGGHMASLAATNWPKPIVLVPCLSWSTASPVFTEGVMSASINWALLQSQYFSNKIYQNDLAKMVKIIHQDDAFLAGQHFAKHFPASMARINRIRNESRTSNTEVKTTKSSIVTADNDPSNRNINDINNNKVENCPMDAEKAAAKLLPLNLLSNKFKNIDSDTLRDNLFRNGIFVCPPPPTYYLAEFLRKGFNLPKVFVLPKNTRMLLNMKFLIDSKLREHEAFEFMRGIMDECTHLKNFEVPIDTELIIAVCARDDAYVPRDGCMSLEEIWPGVEVRYIDAGHITAYLLHQKQFRSTISEAFQRSIKKYPIEDS